MDAPLVSVIVPAYDCADRVADIVAALQAQTLPQFEALLVDDGSTDDTLAQLNAAAVADERLRVLHQDNAGPGAARNAGLDAARAPYVTFMDADDTPDARLLERALGAIERAQADIVVWQTRHFDVRMGSVRPNPDRWDANVWPALFRPEEHAAKLFGAFRNWPWDKMFRRSFLDEQGLRFPALYRTEDLPFTCGALASAKLVATLDEELYTYRIGGESSSTQTLDRAPIDFLVACEQLHDFLHARNLWDTYRASYLPWVGLCVHVNLLGLHTAEGFATAYHALQDGGLARIGLTGIDPAAFRDKAVARTVHAVETLPIEAGTFAILHAEVQRLDALRIGNDLAWENSLSRRVGDVMLAPARSVRDALQRAAKRPR